MFRAKNRLPDLSPRLRDTAPAGPLSDSASDVLRQALAGFLPPSQALFHLLDRMETQQ